MSDQPRSYRYSVEQHLSQVSRLSAVSAFYGPQRLRVLNISTGGIAVLLESDVSNISDGDHLELSVEVRGRSFPVRCEVKKRTGLRLSCQFLEPQPNFTTALKEYLQPKTLGASLEPNDSFAAMTEIKNLVSGSQSFEVFLGELDTGAFVWLDFDRHVLKLVLVSQKLAVEWTPTVGLRTGKNDGQGPEAVVWDKKPEAPVVDYFLDVLSSWMTGHSGESLLRAMSDPDQESRLKNPPNFPRIKAKG
jgi:hypothetical protein